MLLRFIKWNFLGGGGHHNFLLIVWFWQKDGVLVWRLKIWRKRFVHVQVVHNVHNVKVCFDEYWLLYKLYLLN